MTNRSERNAGDDVAPLTLLVEQEYSVEVLSSEQVSLNRHDSADAHKRGVGTSPHDSRKAQHIGEEPMWQPGRAVRPEQGNTPSVIPRVPAHCGSPARELKKLEATNASTPVSMRAKQVLSRRAGLAAILRKELLSLEDWEQLAQACGGRDCMLATLEDMLRTCIDQVRVSGARIQR